MVSCWRINDKCSKYRRKDGLFIFKAGGIDHGTLFCVDISISILSGEWEAAHPRVWVRSHFVGDRGKLLAWLCCDWNTPSLMAVRGFDSQLLTLTWLSNSTRAAAASVAIEHLSVSVLWHNLAKTALLMKAKLLSEISLFTFWLAGAYFVHLFWWTSSIAIAVIRILCSSKYCSPPLQFRLKKYFHSKLHFPFLSFTKLIWGEILFSGS